MTTVFVFLVTAFPLASIAIATRRFGFTVLTTLVASVVGEILGLAVFLFYNHWKAAAFLAGRTPGAVVYFPGTNAATRITTLLVVSAFGALIGVVVLLARYVYSRARSG